MKLLFVLHPNQNSVSNLVRALQYQYDSRIECIDPSNGVLRKSLVGIIYGGGLYVLNMFKLFFRRKDYAAVVLVKPWSITLAIFYKLFFGERVYLDINDPLHLSIFLGHYRFLILSKIFNGKLIFESLEYREYCRVNYKVNGVVLDDYSQWEDIQPIRPKDKEMVIYWYGDALISKSLLEHISFFKYFSQTGGVLKLTGADSKVLQSLTDSGIIVHVPKISNRKDFLIELASSKFVFIPFDRNSILHTQRGNLKAKIAMGAGCVVIAQDIAMHQRLITDGENGFLFEDAKSLYSLTECLTNSEVVEKISNCARATIVELGARKDYLESYLVLATKAA